MLLVGGGVAVAAAVVLLLLLLLFADAVVMNTVLRGVRYQITTKLSTLDEVEDLGLMLKSKNVSGREAVVGTASSLLSIGT